MEFAITKSSFPGPGDGSPSATASVPPSPLDDRKLIKGQHLMEERLLLNEIMQFMKIRYGVLKAELSGMVETVKKEEFAPVADAVSLEELSHKAKSLASKYLEEKPPKAPAGGRAKKPKKV